MAQGEEMLCRINDTVCRALGWRSFYETDNLQHTPSRVGTKRGEASGQSGADPAGPLAPQMRER